MSGDGVIFVYGLGSLVVVSSIESLMRAAIYATSSAAKLGLFAHHYPETYLSKTSRFALYTTLSIRPTTI